MPAGRTAFLAMILALSAAVLGLGGGPAEAATVYLEAPADVEVEAEWVFTTVDIGAPVVGVVSGTDYEITNSAPPFFSVGTTTLTWIVVTEDGGRAIDTQDVVVKDTTPPSCPAGESVSGPHYTNTGKKVAVEVDPPAVRDLVDIDPDISVYSGEKPKYPVGNTTVVFAAEDDHGNIAYCDVIVMVTMPSISGLELVPTPGRIVATWDPFEGDPRYRVFLYDSDGVELRKAVIRGTEYTFPNLDPDTEYSVKVTLQEHSKVYAEASTRTFPLLDISDGFGSSAGWSHVPTTLEPGFNGYAFSINGTVGNPAPSAEISGDGANTSSRIERWFETGMYAGGPLYFGIDYMSETTLFIQFVVDSGDGTPRYVKSAWAGGGTWASHLADISGAFQPGERSRVQVYLHDVAADGVAHALYVDNLVLTGKNPGDPFRGGSGGIPDPDREAFDRALSGILEGGAAPSEYLGSLGAYDGLLRVVLASLDIPY